MNVILVGPPSHQKEEWLHFQVQPPQGQGPDVAVVSGYVDWDPESPMTGLSESDVNHAWYEARYFVGPRWRQINDVSPIAFIAGYSHYSSDEADSTGMRLLRCRWEWIEGPQNPKQQIQLVVTVMVAGGPDAHCRSLGYQLTARGWLLPDQDFKEIDS